MDRQRILEILNGRLKPGRVRHCLGVEQSAVKLARIYGYNEEKASIAALLHDVARDIPAAEMPDAAKKYDIKTDEYELEYPMVLHAKLGAAVAEFEYGIHDAEILQAIARHTTAAPDMSLPDKLIYISDAIEPGREYDDVERLRRLAETDLDKCLLDVIEGCIELMERRGIPPHPITYKALEYYQKELNE